MRAKKKTVQKFDSYVYKVLKQVHPDVGIYLSKSAMAVMDDFITDTFRKLMNEVNYHAKKVQTAAHRKFCSGEVISTSRPNMVIIYNALSSLTKVFLVSLNGVTKAVP